MLALWLALNRGTYVAVKRIMEKYDVMELRPSCGEANTRHRMGSGVERYRAPAPRDGFSFSQAL